MKIITASILLVELKEMQTHYFDDMVKAVIDIDKEILAVDDDLSSDLESALLDEGSQQMDLWGFNIYPELTGEEFIEFDSLINIRPYRGNRSRNVEDPAVRKRIIELAAKLIQ